MFRLDIVRNHTHLPICASWILDPDFDLASVLATKTLCDRLTLIWQNIIDSQNFFAKKIIFWPTVKVGYQLKLFSHYNQLLWVKNIRNLISIRNLGLKSTVRLHHIWERILLLTGHLQNLILNNFFPI
jgi:hypothetical protein